MAVLLLLLLALQFVCLGLLALVRFRAAGLVLLCVQLQRFLVVLGVALTSTDTSRSKITPRGGGVIVTGGRAIPRRRLSAYRRSICPSGNSIGVWYQY